MNFALRTRNCIKNEEFCITNEELCIENDEFCIENDEFCREESLERTSGVELALYPAVMVLMLYLSAVWFVPLSQGTAKVWKEWQAAAQQIKQTKSQKAS